MTNMLIPGDYDKIIDELEAAGENQKAIDFLSDILKIEKQDPYLWLRYGVFLAEDERYSQAIDALNKSASLDNENPSTFFWLAVVYYDINQITDAENMIRKSIKIEPRAGSYNYLSLILNAQDKEVEAEQALNEAIKIDPDFEEAYFNLGVDLKLRGETKKAKTCFEKAISIDPNYASAYQELGFIYIRNKEFTKAIRILKKSIELDDSLFWAKVYLGNVHWHINDVEEAEKWFLKAIEENPDSSNADIFYGQFLIGQERDSEAIELLENRLQLDSENEKIIKLLEKARYFKDNTD